MHTLQVFIFWYLKCLLIVFGTWYITLIIQFEEKMSEKTVQFRKSLSAATWQKC